MFDTILQEEQQKHDCAQQLIGYDKKRVSMQYLSHYLSNSTPAYAGSQNDISIEQASCICGGDSSNTMRISLKNHIGTHIDLPRHFDKEGKILNDYTADQWIFNKVQLIDLPVEKDHMITISDIEGKVDSSIEFLIIKTGFEKNRNNDFYWNSNPGFLPEVGTYLREKFPNLRAIGFDFISLSSFKNRPTGRLAHKKFLVESLPGSPILIVEDMKLSELKSSPSSLIVAPLLINEADGIPVTIFSSEVKPAK